MSCWWRVSAAWVLVVIACSAGAARGESILQLDHGPKTKLAAKKASDAFSPRGMSARDDAYSDGYARFLLNGKKKEPVILASSRKKPPEPVIQWDQKNAKKVKITLPKKPAKNQPKHEAPVQWALAPTPMAPMAPAAMEITTAVPAPNSLWAGLAMMGVLGVWRWWAARRAMSI